MLVIWRVMPTSKIYFMPRIEKSHPYLFVRDQVMPECVELSNTCLVVAQIDLCAHKQLGNVFAKMHYFR